MPKRKYWDQVQPSFGQPSFSSKDDDARFCFVSHSGAHKQFAERLCRDLEARGCTAYFDRESNSPTKGEASGAATLRVAAACRLGILLLSKEFFTASKWPMMELAELMTNYRRGRAKILPIYLTLSISDVTNMRRKAAWLEIWEIWARSGDPRINPEAWKKMVNEDLLEESGIHICRQERIARPYTMIDDDEGRGMIVQRVLTDHSGCGSADPATFVPRAAPYAFKLESILQLATAAPLIPPAAPAVPPAAPAIPPAERPASQYSRGECSQLVKTEYDDSDKDDPGSDKDDHKGGNKDIKNEDHSADEETMPSDEKDQHDSSEESVEHEDGEDEDYEEDEDGAEDDDGDDDYDASDDGDGDHDGNTDSGSDGDNSG